MVLHGNWLGIYWPLVGSLLATVWGVAGHWLWGCCALAGAVGHLLGSLEYWLVVFWALAAVLLDTGWGSTGH